MIPISTANLFNTVSKHTVEYLQKHYPSRVDEFPPLIDEYIKSVIEEEFSTKDLEEVIKKTSYTINRTKKRWLGKVVSDYTKYTEDKLPASKIKVYAQLIERYQHKLVETVAEWEKATDQLLLAFPCFEILTETQRNSAFRKDIIVISGNFIKQEEKNVPRVYDSLNLMIDLAMFSGSKTNSLQLDHETHLDDEDNLFIKVDKLPGSVRDRTPLQMYVDERFLKDLNESIPDLNTQDYELFNDILQFRDTKFSLTRTISVPIRTLVEMTFKDTHYSSWHYETIRKRLLKLGYYRVTEVNEHGDLSLFGAFSDVTIYDREGQEYARCVVSDKVFSAFLNHEITSIYSTELPKLKGRISYKLVFYLQKERLLAYQAGIDSPIKMDYRQFFDTIRLINRTKREKLNIISKALQEIKDVGIILKDFNLSGNYFFLTFEDLSDQELLGHKIPKNLIE